MSQGLVSEEMEIYFLSPRRNLIISTQADPPFFSPVRIELVQNAAQLMGEEEQSFPNPSSVIILNYCLGKMAAVLTAWAHCLDWDDRVYTDMLTALLAYLKEMSNLEGKISALPFPAYKRGQHFCPVPGWKNEFMVSSYSEGRIQLLVRKEGLYGYQLSLILRKRGAKKLYQWFTKRSLHYKEGYELLAGYLLSLTLEICLVLLLYDAFPNSSRQGSVQQECYYYFLSRLHSLESKIKYLSRGKSS